MTAAHRRQEPATIQALPCHWAGQCTNPPGSDRSSPFGSTSTQTSSSSTQRQVRPASSTARNANNPRSTGLGSVVGIVGRRSRLLGLPFSMLSSPVAARARTDGSMDLCPAAVALPAMAPRPAGRRNGGYLDFLWEVAPARCGPMPRIPDTAAAALRGDGSRTAPPCCRSPACGAGLHRRTAGASPARGPPKGEPAHGYGAAPPQPAPMRDAAEDGGLRRSPPRNTRESSVPSSRKRRWPRWRRGRTASSLHPCGHRPLPPRDVAEPLG